MNSHISYVGRPVTNQNLDRYPVPDPGPALSPHLGEIMDVLKPTSAATAAGSGVRPRPPKVKTILTRLRLATRAGSSSRQRAPAPPSAVELWRSRKDELIALDVAY
ncbi:hypothetical protein EVAR_21041_1 [Eumeta japonica]|uniref:Uncharacterized protein n=1 Tax=Eumeta variegata TaxID=151549 RepID=A0A4C1UZU7_EUMVA|nr:hypothetical protein EVAR_21041_1 [Eumeta japonica]